MLHTFNGLAKRKKAASPARAPAVIAFAVLAATLAVIKNTKPAATKDEPARAHVCVTSTHLSLYLSLLHPLLAKCIMRLPM